MQWEELVIVLVTVSASAEGENIARRLVEERLAACVNLIPNLGSYFRWQEKLTEENEGLLVIKTRRSLLDALIGRIKELHSYEVPEILALPIVGGSEDYLRWVMEETPARLGR